MLWVWILGILLALTVLVCMLRLGILIRFGRPVFVWIRIGPFRIQAAPSNPEKEEAQKKKEKRGHKKKERDWSGTLKKLQSSAKISPSEIAEAARALWPPFKRALNRTRRGVRISPLQLSVVLGGGEDPARAAEQYGYASAAVWTVMPALEQLLTIPDPGIHLGVDYTSDRTAVQGEAGLSVRVGTLIAIGLGMALPALRWYLEYRKKHGGKTPEQTKQDTGAPETPAA
ncbi:MAG: DUF2953 domain-containing protein [Oscillibacter sp.]|jgi:hypothetical protein|nr:DUF2953 domain-containing protein [Oscillibacter sp.]